MPLRPGHAATVEDVFLPERRTVPHVHPGPARDIGSRAEQDVEVLLRIHRELGGSFALDCEVVQSGRARVGDPVELR